MLAAVNQGFEFLPGEQGAWYGVLRYQNKTGTTSGNICGPRNCWRRGPNFYALCKSGLEILLGGPMQRIFGSKDSRGRKLEVISQYLAMYQRAMSNTSFQTHYMDAFAGTGEVPIAESEGGLLDDEAKAVLAGSADRALRVSPPFTSYTFVDKRRKCIDALKTRFQGHPLSDRVSYSVGDANEHVQQFCASRRWRSERGVVLLDPFGNQVRWETIEAIAQTKGLDLWYLFPAGLGVFRQISRDGSVDPTHEPSITRLFGTDQWKEAFLKESTQGDLFGQAPRREKVVTPESAAAFMIERLKSVFEGGVLDAMVPLGKHAYPSYYLLFAWSNPSKSTRKLAAKLSKAAINATDRIHGRLI